MLVLLVLPLFPQASVMTGGGQATYASWSLPLLEKSHVCHIEVDSCDVTVSWLVIVVN